MEEYTPEQQEEIAKMVYDFAFYTRATILFREDAEMIKSLEQGCKKVIPSGIWNLIELRVDKIRKQLEKLALDVKP